MMMTNDQLKAAMGLFQQMNDHTIAADPAVFTMFGIMLGALKARETMIEQPDLWKKADAAVISDDDLREIEQHCIGIDRTMADGAVIMRLVSAVRAARRERDDYGAEIRRMCGTMTPEEIHTEKRHRDELDRVDRTVEHRTAGAIADWVSDELDIGPLNPYTEKQRVVDGIRSFAWKEQP